MRSGTWRGWLAAILLVIVLVWSARGTNFSLAQLQAGMPDIIGFLRKLFPTEDRPWDAEYLAPGVVGITAYGWRRCQLDAALARLLAPPQPL